MTADYDIIIGLEIHVQLQTRSKLFCGCSTQFGAVPNSQTCFVCTGMPGALPVLNARALELAIKTGLALNCQIERKTKWDRKNYFYPDLPKGYQISQFDRPICYEGSLQLVDSKGGTLDQHVRIERAHLEEDAGKSNHDETGQGGDSRIDLNRAGTPLLEIVTRPDLKSAEDARNFLNELKLILTYIGVSDCNMQQGNLRVDANVNVWIDRAKNIATPIVEVKNLNSFRAVERAIQFESERQWQLYQENGQTTKTAPKQTRGWDDDRQRTTLQREKEDSADYRYFPDPDLVAIQVPPETIERIRLEIVSLPNSVRRELIEQGLSSDDANVLVRQGAGLVNFFRQVAVKVGDPKLASNWIQQEVLRFLNEMDAESAADEPGSIENYPVSIDEFSNLLTAVSNRTIDQSRGKDVLNTMVNDRAGFEAAKTKLGIVTVALGEIEALCQQIINGNPSAIADIEAGNVKAIGALIGQARNMNPNANPNDVRKILLKMLKQD